MTTKLLLVLTAASVIAGCASVRSTPAGLEAGKFVAFDCEGQDFQARFDPEGNTVRVRSHSGAAELSAAGNDEYQGDGFKLSLKGKDGVALEHGGKVLGKNCKRV